jgi:hypothetical protein
MKEEPVLLPRQEFVRVSIEVNLFYQRIMKEHLFLIEANLQPVATTYILEANRLRRNFEQLLNETIYYANGLISENVLKSNEIVTPFTLKAEQINSMLTGVNLNTEITKKEYELVNKSNYESKVSENAINNINRRSYSLIEEGIEFQQNLLALSLGCRIFISLYNEMLEHTTHEAIYYQEILKSLLKDRNLPIKALCEELNFWNNIMGEHAQFIDGMLDPTEKSLKKMADTTAKKFEKLIEECIKSAENQIIQKSLISLEGIRDFKRKATEGLLECKIKSIIPCLLADHVLREANHYLRLLHEIKYKR